MLTLDMTDDQLFGTLQAVIKKRVPKFKIKYKDESKWQKFIGKIAFFNKGYMTDYTTTLGSTVYFPSREFVRESNMRAFKILAHEYVHILDRQKLPIVFELLYVFPQFLSMFSLLAILSFFFGMWWLLSLVALLALLPWPAVGRTSIEMRGYAMNIAINIWRHGHLSANTKKWLTETFTGSNYYYMWPYEDAVRLMIEDEEALVYNVDSTMDANSILQHSDAYQDVYELLTGIEYDG